MGAGIGTRQNDCDRSSSWLGQLDKGGVMDPLILQDTIHYQRETSTYHRPIEKSTTYKEKTGTVVASNFEKVGGENGGGHDGKRKL